MKGDGFYDGNSDLQRRIIQSVLPLLQKAAGQVPPPANSAPYTLVDYGCSEGSNSIFTMKLTIDIVRSIYPHLGFMVVHNDLPANNFNRLFSALQSDQSGYATVYGASIENPVFVFASGQSFCTQVMPANSVHLGFSSASLHWSSRVPPGLVHDHIACYLGTADEVERGEALALADWKNFLTARYAELAPGGRLIITAGAKYENGEEAARQLERFFHLSTKRPLEFQSAEVILTLLNEVLLEAADQGHIDKQRLREFAMPLLCRSMSEWRAPFTTADCPADFVLEHAYIETIGCPHHERYKMDGDKLVYAKALTNLVRAFAEPSLVQGLFPTKKGDSARAMDIIFQTLERRIAADPDRYTFYPIQAVLVVAKTQ